MLEATAPSANGPHSSRSPHSAWAAAAALWRHACRAFLPLLLLLGPVTAAAAGPGAAERRSAADEDHGARLDRAEELRRQLRDYHQRWRSESAVTRRAVPPALPQASSLSPASPPRYPLMAADGAGRAEVGGKVLEPPGGVEARLTDAERDLLHRQLRQAAREQPISRAR